MKKINLRGLSEKLSAKELKNVLGGSWDHANDVCVATDYMDENGYYRSYDCYTGIGAAEEAAAEGSGPNGWWCCNCEDAMARC